MKRWLAVLLSLMMVLSATALAEDEAVTDRNLIGDGKTVVRIAFDGESFSRDALIEVSQAFFDETGISVELMFVPVSGSHWPGFLSKIQTMIAGGDTPDLIRIAVEGFELFRQNGLLEPMTEYIEKYPEWAAKVSDNHEKLSAPYVVDGEYYGFGFDWNTVLTFVNLNVLEEAGLQMPAPEDWTMELFEAYAKAMTFTREDGTKVYGVNVPDWYFVVESWLYNNGASIMNEDYTEAVCNSPEAVEVIQKIHDLIYVDEVAPVSPANFMADQVGMIFIGRWFLKGCYESEFFDLDVLPVPTMATNQAIAGGGCFPISATSAVKDEAFKLACYLGSPEVQAKIMEISAMPCSVSAMESIVQNSDFPANVHLFMDSADTAKFVESPPDYGAVDEVFIRYLSLVLADEMEPQQAMDLAKDEIDMILAGF